MQFCNIYRHYLVETHEAGDYCKGYRYCKPGIILLTHGCDVFCKLPDHTRLIDAKNGSFI